MATPITESHWRLARRYGKRPFQSPVNESLAGLLGTIFSEEEASIASAFPIQPAGVDRISRGAGMSREEGERLLRAMDGRGLILAFSLGGERKYSLVPIIPGLFELTMCRGKKDPKSRAFAKFFEAYYNRDYFPKPRPEGVVKIIPVERCIPDRAGVLPSEKVSELIDRHTSFSLATCSCRHSRELARVSDLR